MVQQQYLIRLNNQVSFDFYRSEKLPLHHVDVILQTQPLHGELDCISAFSVPKRTTIYKQGGNFVLDNWIRLCSLLSLRFVVSLIYVCNLNRQYLVKQQVVGTIRKSLGKLERLQEVGQNQDHGSTQIILIVRQSLGIYQRSLQVLIG